MIIPRNHGYVWREVVDIVKKVGEIGSCPVAIGEDTRLSEIAFDILDREALRDAINKKLGVMLDQSEVMPTTQIGSLVRSVMAKLRITRHMTIDDITNEVLDILHRLLGYDVVNLHACTSMAELVPAKIAQSTYRIIRKEIETTFGITLPVGRNFAINNAAGYDDVINSATTIAAIIRIVATELGAAMPDDKPSKPTRQLLAIGRTEESECITVKELIEFLNGMPGDSPIVLGPLDTQWDGNLRYAAQTTDGSKVFLTNTKYIGELARDLVYKFEFNHGND